MYGVTPTTTSIQGVWKIENVRKFFSYGKDDTKFESPEFVFPTPHGPIAFKLVLFPNIRGLKNSRDSYPHHSVIQLHCSNPKLITTTFLKFSADEAGQNIFSIAEQPVTFNHNRLSSEIKILHQNVEYPEIRQPPIAGDDLQVQWRISCLLPEESDVREYLKAEPLRGLFNNAEFSDFTITIGEATFKTHKAVLALRSDYFTTLLKSNMKEAMENVLAIKDEALTMADVETALRFIYGEELDSLPDDCTGVLRVADMWDLYGLKEVAEDQLTRKVQIGNWCEMAILADKFDARRLKRACAELKLWNVAAFLKRADWKELRANYPLLVLELMEMD